MTNDQIARLNVRALQIAEAAMEEVKIPPYQEGNIHLTAALVQSNLMILGLERISMTVEKVEP